MKLEYITIAGTSYPLCLSLAAIEKIDERLGGLETALDRMHDGTLIEQLSVTADLLQIMLEQGRAAKKALGEDTPALPPVHVKYLLDMYDLNAADAVIAACVNGSTERAQEASPPKNTSPMPEDTPPL